MRSLLYALLLVLAAPAAAQPSMAQIGELQAAIEELQADRCRQAERRAAKLLASPGLNAEFRSYAAFVRFTCLYALKRPAEVRAAATALAEAPAGERMHEAWFIAAAATGQLDDAEEALRQAIARDPATVRAIDPSIMGDALNDVREAGGPERRRRLVLMLADIGFGGDDLAVRDGYFAQAIAQHLEAGRREDAERLARLMVSRPSLVRLLTDRRAEPLWPLLEASAGPGMARTSRAAVEAARNHAEALGPAESSDRAAQARLGLIEALWATGDHDEALAEGAKVLATAEALARASEDAGWVVNEHGYALARSGQVAAADARFRGLTELDIAERPWLISMRINRAGMLLAYGREADVLTLAEGLRADAARFGTPYARQLVRRAEACALARTGRVAQAAALKPELLKHAADARMATAEALLCLGARGEAGAELVAALGDSRWRDGAIEELQPEGVWPDWRMDTLRALRDDPAVAAAYAREGRDLPEGLRGG